jgi:type IV secretory pathway TrbD component
MAVLMSATESARATTAANLPEYRPVYRSLHRPLTVCGVDRRLFFLALMIGVAAFNLFYSFLAGCLLFAAVYAFAWVSTARDPQMLQILLRSAHARGRYDAAKHDRVDIEVRW